LNSSRHKKLLLDIQTRVSRAKIAQKYLMLTQETLDQGLNQLAFDATLYYLVNIGEAVSKLDDSFREINPDIPWKEIVGLRNRLAHDYDTIDVELVQATLSRPLDDLMHFCTNQIQGNPNESLGA
jgi:uncharacterized protein with HEPN domain